ncbi:MAG: thymidine kinase [Calditrichaeota bacterium]|nr:MAG: thymidine kinase [Calditrichota bacterium]MBL1205852.1 thymidine kinase [Calditrichota bacterium]NOG45679.1 thymidine kinase [Calditrichota bacterium]
MNVLKQHTGWIEVICGSMFSGKTEELIRRMRRAMIARQKIELFKPQIDKRYSEIEIVSHDMQKIPSHSISKPKQILSLALESQVVGIDEAQFFDRSLIKVCQTLANMGKRVIIAGLDQDYRGVPFEPIPDLLAIAEYITKTHAICVICGNPANHTQRTSNQKDKVVVGAGEFYEARCRNCYEPPTNHKEKK